MTIPEAFLPDVNALPPRLRSLLDAELAAGIEIVEVGHDFPAPPRGAWLRLARRVTTVPREPTSTLMFWENDQPSYSGQFTDAAGLFQILEPPRELRPTDPNYLTDPTLSDPPEPTPPKPEPTGAVERFKASTDIDYEKWREGEGFDIAAIRGATPDERTAIERMVLDEPPRGWRDVEALAALDTYRTRKALRRALTEGDDEVRMAVLRFAPELLEPGEREATLIGVLEDGEFYSGLTSCLDEVAEYHPPAIVDALLRGAMGREGGIATHFAAMIAYVHGQAAEPFDWAHRPFYLRFNTEDRGERVRVFRELCQRCGIDPSPYCPAR
jgi:hypothetical protein